MTDIASEAAELEDAVNLVRLVARYIATGDHMSATQAASALGIAVAALSETHAALQLAIDPNWHEIGDRPAAS